MSTSNHPHSRTVACFTPIKCAPNCSTTTASFRCFKSRATANRRLFSNALVRLWARLKVEVKVRVQVDRWLSSNARVRLWARVKVEVRVKVDRWLSSNGLVRLWTRVRVKVRARVQVDRRLSSKRTCTSLG